MKMKAENNSNCVWFCFILLPQKCVTPLHVQLIAFSQQFEQLPMYVSKYNRKPREIMEHENRYNKSNTQAFIIVLTSQLEFSGSPNSRFQYNLLYFFFNYWWNRNRYVLTLLVHWFVSKAIFCLFFHWKWDRKWVKVQIHKKKNRKGL